MEKIDSFKVNHLMLEKGIYVSRVDKVGDSFVTTYDIRVCTPNKDWMSPGASHTLEHIIATYLRTVSPIKDSVIYFGPMGCLTGFYLIVKNCFDEDTIYHEIQAAFETVLALQDESQIPGKSAIECGNAQLHSLSTAKVYARDFSRILTNGGFPRTYPLSKIVVICAMPEEVAKLKGKIIWESHLPGVDVKCVISGVGKVNAAIAAERAITEHEPDIVISFGFAGGMPGSSIKRNDVIVATDVAYHDVWHGKPNLWGQVQGMPEVFHCATYRNVRETFGALLGTVAHYGVVLTGDSFITNKEDVRVAVNTRCCVVDMEAAAIAQVCYMHDVKFMAFKQISDIIGEENQEEKYEESKRS